jgi:hypothetical protein
MGSRAEDRLREHAFHMKLTPPKIEFGLFGYSGWACFCAMFSIFGLTGYYSEMFKPHMPDWLGVALLMAPLLIVMFIQWGEAPDRVVASAHIIAASWFMVFAIGMEVGILYGYKPKETELFRIMAHLGWTFAWAGILRRARQSRKLERGSDL